MKALNIFSKILVILGVGVGFMVGHGVYAYFINKPNLTLRSMTKLGVNPLENNTLFFRYFEISDYLGGHFYFPGANILGNESFTYRVKTHE